MSRIRRQPSPAAKARPQRRARRTSRAGDALAGNLTRTRILQGAAAVLAAQGLAATTVEDILRAAGVSRRTFYQWFANLEEVLEGLYDFATKLMVDAVRSAVESRTDPGERLEAGLSTYLESQRGVGPLAALLHAEAMRPESRLAARHDAAIDAFVRLYDEGMWRDQGRRVDPLVFRALVLAVEGITIYLQQRGAVTDAAIARTRGVLRAITGRALAPDQFSVLPLPLANGARGHSARGRH